MTWGSADVQALCTSDAFRTVGMRTREALWREINACVTLGRDQRAGAEVCCGRTEVFRKGVVVCAVLGQVYSDMFVVVSVLTVAGWGGGV